MKNFLLIFVVVLLAACANKTTASPPINANSVSTATSIPPPINTSSITGSPSVTSTITPKTALSATKISTKLPLTDTPVPPNDLSPLAQVVITESDIWNYDDPYLDYFRSNLSSSDATNELREYCLLDCVKRVFYGRNAALTIIMMRAGDPDKARRTVATLYDDYLAQQSHLYEYIEEREWIDAPEESSWILALSSDDYALSVSYGSIIILLRWHVPGTDDGYTQVILLSIFANLQLDKLEAAGFPR